MKKLLAFAALFAVVALTSCKYDDDDLWHSVHGLENRVAKLEELCKQMNTNISSLQTIVTALQNNVYVTGTAPLMQDGKEIGYTITFSKGNPITIYHGKDGQDGEDGTTPTIGVKKDTDGVYYWTLNGEFIVVDGGKIQAEGKDGINGTNGTTPQFKIENDYWFISYDNGNTWMQLGKATGENGKDGEDGVGGDSMFTGIDYKTSTDYVIFTLADGTQIKLPTWSAFEALQRLCNETNTNLSALQTIVTALQNNDYITSVDPLTEDGKVVGYTIKFAKSNPIVIYNGKDGADGNTPVIGVKKDTDGIHNCKSLATVTFEKKSRLRTIGGGYVSASKSHYGAFSNCTVLTDIEIPASVETIETAAFMGCSSLQTVTFEKGSRLRTIAGQGLSTGTISVTHGAFYKLEKLMTVDMSECTQVESIENCAFHGDSELQLFKIGMKTPPSCGFAAFSDINSSSVLKVPSGCTDAYKAASGWKNFASITGLDE